MPIEARGLRRAIEEIERLAERYPDATRAEAEDVLEQIAVGMESATVRYTPRGVGGSAGLAGSIAGSVSVAGSVARATWGTPLKYGEAVEFGRAPGKMPPSKPLELWARRILEVSDKAAPGVAKAIAWKIFSKGTEGAHMFERAWDEHERWAYGLIEQLPKRIVERVNYGG